MPRLGRALETLVAHLEKTLIGSEGVTVESPAHLLDKVTQQPREIDVLVTIKRAHHVLQTAFEVKDVKSRIAAPLIEQFATKTTDVGVQDKYFVAANGYTKPALVKAHHHNIKCLSLGQVLDLKWFVAGGMNCVTRQREPPQFEFVPIDELKCLEEATLLNLSTRSEPGRSLPMSIIASSGSPIDVRHIGNLAWSSVSDDEPIDQTVQYSEQRMKDVTVTVDPANPIFLVWHGSSNRHQLRFVRVRIPYKLEVQVVPFALQSYSFADGQQLAESANSSEIDACGAKLALSFVKDAATGVMSVHLRARKEPSG